LPQPKNETPCDQHFGSAFDPLPCKEREAEFRRCHRTGSGKTLAGRMVAASTAESEDVWLAGEMVQLLLFNKP
jgi:hypothetical protein